MTNLPKCFRCGRQPCNCKDVTLYLGDCLDVMAAMEAESVTAIVCDPPYGLEFMGKEWDKFGISESRAKRLSGADAPAGDKFFGYREGCENRGRYTELTPKEKSTMQEFFYRVFLTALRVAKPGCHLLAFGGTRTHHRLVCAIEDAGWEIRDCLMWVYGSGFPKSLDVSKAIDKGLYTTKTCNPDFQKVRAWIRAKVKAKGLTYKQIDTALGNANSHKASHYLDNSQPQLPTPRDWEVIKGLLELSDEADIDRPPALLVETFEREILGYRAVQKGVAFTSDGKSEVPITKPLSPEAEQWQGYGTALKPAWEPIILARKPLDGTVAANVLEHGCGALNIDGCRLECNQRIPGNKECTANKKAVCYGDMKGNAATYKERVVDQGLGRFPANLIHDGSEEVVGLFPETASGKMTAGTRRAAQDCPGSVCYGTYGGDATAVDTPGGSGSAARFFYCAKASRAERWSILTCNCETVKLSAWEKRPDQNRAEQTGATSPKTVTCGEPSPDDSAISTTLSGKENTEQSYLGTTSTTKTETDSTIASETYSLLPTQNTSESTVGAKSSTVNGGSPAESAVNSNRLPSNISICHGKDGRCTGVVGPATSIALLKPSGKEKLVCVACQSDVRTISHPTLKPLDLMSYLCRLVSAPNHTGLLLDPFAGSGSTLLAASRWFERAVGIEQNEKYCEIAANRLRQEVLF